MIPIDETKPEEKEIDGVKYSLLPLTGENELLYYKVLKLTSPSDLKKNIAIAKAEIEKENVDKQWAHAEKENAIRERALKNAESADDSSIYDNVEALKALDALIDAVLIDWSSSTIKLPDFPQHKKPSRCFKLIDKMKLLNIISDSVLVKEEERKN